MQRYMFFCKCANKVVKISHFCCLGSDLSMSVAFGNKVVLTDDGAFGNVAFDNEVVLTDDGASSLRRLMSPLSQK